MAAERKHIHRGTLPATVKNSDLGSRYITVVLRLWPRFVLILAVAAVINCGRIATSAWVRGLQVAESHPRQQNYIHPNPILF